MVLVHVEYDAYTRQFKLIDREMARALVDGETYIVMADVSVQDVMRGGSEAPVRVEGGAGIHGVDGCVTPVRGFGVT